MKLVVKIPWWAGGFVQDELWKVMAMPALPPVGTLLFPDHNFCLNIDALTVKEIQFWEDNGWFEVIVETLDVADAPSQFVADMAEHGWHYERDAPWIDFAKQHRPD